MILLDSYDNEVNIENINELNLESKRTGNDYDIVTIIKEEFDKESRKGLSLHTLRLDLGSMTAILNGRRYETNSLNIILNAKGREKIDCEFNFIKDEASIYGSKDFYNHAVNIAKKYDIDNKDNYVQDKNKYVINETIGNKTNKNEFYKWYQDIKAMPDVTKCRYDASKKEIMFSYKYTPIKVKAYGKNISYNGYRLTSAKGLCSLLDEIKDFDRNWNHRYGNTDAIKRYLDSGDIKDLKVVNNDAKSKQIEKNKDTGLIKQAEALELG